MNPRHQVEIEKNSKGELAKALVSTQLTVRGRFRLVTRKADTGEVAKDTGWFDNLITNNGLDYLATQNPTSGSVSWFEYIHVGTGSTTPSVTDTALQTRIASTNSSDPDQADYSGIDTVNRFCYAVRVRRFGVGVAAGNLSEIGTGGTSVGATIFSRALIKDEFGAPTTLTVLSDEFLSVYYEFRVNQPVADYNAVVSGYTTVLRAALANDTAVWSATRVFSSWNHAFYPSGSSWSGVLGAITAEPVSKIANWAAANGAYTNGTYTRTITLTAGLTVSNGTAIQCITYNFGPSRWQFSIDPTILKDSTQTIDITVRLTWAREGELP